MTRRSQIALVALASAAGAAHAAPGFQITPIAADILLREDLRLNLPAELSRFGVAGLGDIDINDAGQVIFDFSGFVYPPGSDEPVGHNGVWYGSAEGGAPIVFAPDSEIGLFVGGPAINNAGVGVWSHSQPVSLWRRNTDGTIQNLGNIPLNAVQSYQTLDLTDDGRIAGRMTLGLTVWAIIDPSQNFPFNYVEIESADDAPIFFLFTPSVNSSGTFAGKVQLVDNDGDPFNPPPVEIRVYSGPGTYTTIAQNVALDPSSTFRNFDNSIGFADDGSVVFYARSDAADTVQLYRGGQLVTVATEGQDNIASFGTRAPSVTSDGSVYFDAKLANAPAETDFVIFRWRDGELTQVLREGDPLTINGAPFEFGFSDPTQQAIGSGAIANNNGVFAINIAVRPRAGEPGASATGGEAIVIVSESDEPECPADFDGNGAVNVNDLLGFLGAFRTQDASSDFDGNGVVNVNDLLGFLGAFRNGCPA